MTVAADATPDLREAIIAAATRLFAEQGYSATSVRQLVTEAHCTKPALYYHFGSKEALFRETVQRHLDEMDHMVRTLLSQGGPVRQVVHRAIAEFLDYSVAHPHVFRLLARIDRQREEGAPDMDLMASRNTHQTILRELMQRGIDSGELRAGIDPLDCAILVDGAISYQCERSLACAEDLDRERIHRTIDLLFDGIAP